ncbi:hypothetical protein [Streptomyces sp. NPDC057889]
MRNAPGYCAALRVELKLELDHPTIVIVGTAWLGGGGRPELLAFFDLPA